jgi:hypothetical protein
LIREYERELSEKDKKELRKEIALAESSLSQTRKSVIIKIIVLTAFAFIIYTFPRTWLIIILSIVSFFMIWMLILEVKDLINIPRFLTKKKSVIDTGIAHVREFQIDRYIKIKSYEDEGNHYIIEHERQLVMIGGQDFDGVRKLKNKIEFIEITDSVKKAWYHSRVEKYGTNLEPFHVFTGKLPEDLITSDLWNNLTEQVPFEGGLEDLNKYINKP